MYFKTRAIEIILLTNGPAEAQVVLCLCEAEAQDWYIEAGPRDFQARSAAYPTG